MPKEFDELSEEAKQRALRSLKRDRGYRESAGGWEKECAEGGIVEFLRALGFSRPKWESGGIRGDYGYRKSSEVKKDLDNCPYANEEIYRIWKWLIQVQRQYQFDLSASMRFGNIQNVYKGSRYANVPDLEDALYALQTECQCIVEKSVNYIYDEEYMMEELRANVPGGFNDDGTEADPYGIYNTRGERVDEWPEDVDPFRRRFNRVG